MSNHQIFLSFLIIFQFVNNSLANYGEEHQLQIFTPATSYSGDRHYQYHETSDTNCLSFKVRADKDAHIALASAPNRKEPWIEIVIGGWGNTRSVIRRDETDYIQPNARLNSNEYIGFWITWNDDGEIRVGREGVSEPFMSWNDPEPVDIKYFAVSLCWNSYGSWIIEEPSCPNVVIKRKRFQISGASQISGPLPFFVVFVLSILNFIIFKF